MKDAIFHISLDIDDAYSQANMNLCQGESGRLAAISLRQSGKAFAVEGCRAVCAGTRPDSSVFFIDCTIENGIIFCPFSAVHTAVPGTVKAEIRLYGSKDVLIASPAFSLEIRESAMDDGPVAEGEEATALTALIADTMEAMEAMAAGTITAARVNVDNGAGEPSATVELSPGEGGQTISFAFSNLKGDKGDRGEKGEAGMDGAPGKDGVNGKDGENGKEGRAGRDGVSPAVTLSRSGTVTTLSVTDALGTKTAQIYDGAKGEKGDKGAPGADGATGKAGADGADGKNGIDGLNGNSIFIVEISSEYQNTTVPMSAIINGDRPVQVGDLLLQKNNGRIHRVVSIYEDVNRVSCEYTGSTLSGGSGGGTDVLNENGIIKQQHFPGGFPYAEPAVFLPETEPVFSADMGGFIIMSGLDADMFIVGQSYTVNWNGTEYVSQAAVQDDGSMKAIVLGDMGAMQGAPTTGEPFVIMILDAAAQAAMGIAAMVIPIDGSMSITLSISGEAVTPVDTKFLPGGRVVIIKRVDNGAPSMTYADALAALKNGALLVFRDCTTSIGLIYDYSFTSVAENELETNPYLTFTNVEASDISHIAINKILMYSDGTIENVTVN